MVIKIFLTHKENIQYSTIDFDTEKVFEPTLLFPISLNLVFSTKFSSKSDAEFFSKKRRDNKINNRKICVMPFSVVSLYNYLNNSSFQLVPSLDLKISELFEIIHQVRHENPYPSPSMLSLY